MPPATILLIIQGLQAAIAAAPAVEDLVIKTKDYLGALFAAGLITAPTQDALSAHIDSVCAAVLAGQIPPEFTLEPDPA